MNSRESERSSSFAPTDRQGPKWPLHPRATGSGAPWSVPKCRQKRNVPICRLEGTEEDGVGSGFAELELVAGIELGGTAGVPVGHGRFECRVEEGTGEDERLYTR